MSQIERINRFNGERIIKKQIDTFIGLCQGVLADGKVNQTEAEFLQTWLVANTGAVDNPLFNDLRAEVDAMLEDGKLDNRESENLVALLRKLCGEPSELGELSRPTMLPLDDPAPAVHFNDATFLFTGTFSYGKRSECQQVVLDLQGRCASTVTKKVDFLVIGDYVTDSWRHEKFGTKILKAVEYKEKGIPIKIISERHWTNALNTMVGK
ncbi:BRCT domain-containing protein [Granulosicoccaceae sp. 1_MG-2023]|nr:BRCT domain-containing protein [Granulosicoccaceae sp. 1_MG-2023]